MRCIVRRENAKFTVLNYGNNLLARPCSRSHLLKPPPHLRQHILVKAASQGDVQHLNAATDGQQRLALRHRPARQRLRIGHRGDLSGRRAAVSLLTVMLSLKLVECYRIRDARLLVSFSLFLCATQFLFGQKILMPFYGGVVTVLALVTFARLQRMLAFCAKRRAAGQFDVRCSQYAGAQRA